MAASKTTQADTVAEPAKAAVPVQLSADSFAAGLTPLERVLFAGALASSPELRAAELTGEEWAAKLATYRTSPCI